VFAEFDVIANSSPCPVPPVILSLFQTTCLSASLVVSTIEV
jgi:hypothetical protein